MRRVLVVNAGSVTLKLTVVGPVGEVDSDTYLDPWDGDDPGEAFAGPRAAGPIDAVGHRVVHGGEDLTAPTLVDPEVERAIDALTPLAPLHQPRALAAIRAARRHLPDVPHVASFDTAFHATLPAAARTYALPADWRDRWGLPRFGFHGLSHAWVARRVLALIGEDLPARRVVSCHLGAGASLAAILDGESVDTTMGFTPLEGVVMAQRSGSVDPGLLLWLQTEGGLSAAEVKEGLERRSGIAGLSGTSGDFRALLAARADGDEAAALAFDVYVHRLRTAIGAMAASLGGVDVLVFTGGVGEHVPVLRDAAGAGLGHLGILVDPDANAAVRDGEDADISATGAPARTLVVTSREDLEIADQVRRTVPDR